MNRKHIDSSLRRHYNYGQSGRWVLISEVRNSTGYAARRSIDLLVIEAYPSDGCRLHAIEIKVSVSDLRRELRDPAKAWELERYCDLFSIAVPASMPLPDNVPVEWGVFRIKEDSTCVVEREPQQRRNVWPPDRPLIAAIARRLCKLKDESIPENQRLGSRVSTSSGSCENSNG